MTGDTEGLSVLELQARWDRLRIANVYDVLDKLGYSNQCLDLRIRPLVFGGHLAGKAVTAKGGRDPRSWEDIQAEGKDTQTLVRIADLLFPGSVVVVECGGEMVTGKFGEMTSWNLQQAGARGIVLDSYIRDRLGLDAIPNYTVCALGTSPVESSRRWRVQATNVPICMPGTLTSQVRVNPGDWIVGGADGVIVVPEEVSMEALVKAEDLEAREEGMRKDLAAGMSFKDAYEKWGRA